MDDAHHHPFGVLKFTLKSSESKIYFTNVQASKDGQNWQALLPSNALVVPPGSSLVFHQNHRCHLGYGIRITIQPEGVTIADNHYYVILGQQGSETPR